MVAVGLLAGGCSGDEGEAVVGLITADNIGSLLTASEVDAVARDDVDVQSVVVDLLGRADAERIPELTDVETWFGVDFAETGASASVSRASRPRPWACTPSCYSSWTTRRYS